MQDNSVVLEACGQVASNEFGKTTVKLEKLSKNPDTAKGNMFFCPATDQISMMPACIYVGEHHRMGEFGRFTGIVA